MGTSKSVTITVEIIEAVPTFQPHLYANKNPNSSKTMANPKIGVAELTSIEDEHNNPFHISNRPLYFLDIYWL